MKNTIPRKYAELIEDSSINIEIVESRWEGKEVSISHSRGNNFTREELKNVRIFLNEYKDIILKVHEITEKYSGVKQAWEIGRVAESVINEKKITNGDFALITQVGHSDDGTYVHQMRQVYKIFPNEEYAQEHFGKSSMCELTQTVDSELVRKINKNALHYDIQVRTYRLRAIRDAYKSNGNIKKAVEKSLNRNLFKRFDDNKVIRIIYDAHLLLEYSDIDISQVEKYVKEIRS